MRSRMISTRAVEVGLLQRPVLRRHRLERHLEAALEVEAERRLLFSGEPGIVSRADADQAGDDQRDENEVGSTIHEIGSGGRLAAVLVIRVSARVNASADRPRAPRARRRRSRPPSSLLLWRDHGRDRAPRHPDLDVRRDLHHELVLAELADEP